MFIVTRKAGEAVVINDQIRVVVLERRPHGQVKLGIEAPRIIRVDREEVHQRRLAEAARCQPAAVLDGSPDGGLAG